MHKPLTLLLFLFALVLCFVSISDVSSQSNSEDEVVESVTLDKTKATLACPWVMRSKSSFCQEDERKIMISTFSPSAEKNGWDYYYFVTGGKIIGEGAKVVWDFSFARPGNHSITVGVGKDGVIKGNLITKNVAAELCECHPTCSCPGISVLGPTGVAKRGDTLIFTVNVVAGSQDRPNFNWTVSDEEIIKIIQSENQSQILVKTSSKTKAKKITVTVEVGGLCADCTQRVASATAKIK